MANITNTQLRIDSELFAKAKILAAVYGDSFNGFIVRMIKDAIFSYEDEYGALPKPIELVDPPSDSQKPPRPPQRV